MVAFVTANLKEIYIASNEPEAQLGRERFADKSGDPYPKISKSWPKDRPKFFMPFEYPPKIHEVIYTTNAIEPLNNVIHKATKLHKVFPPNNSTMKVVYLAVQAALKK
ncbi:transposase [Microbulbifer epialgicus]|uniref:Mutator family transposase n=1 Tax=Microbulbifer epialgicus TaxID=393907 RepID=A0ABV4P1J6_9GAMM